MPYKIKKSSASCDALNEKQNDLIFIDLLNLNDF